MDSKLRNCGEGMITTHQPIAKGVGGTQFKPIRPIQVPGAGNVWMAMPSAPCNEIAWVRRRMAQARHSSEQRTFEMLWCDLRNRA